MLVGIDSMVYFFDMLDRFIVKNFKNRRMIKLPTLAEIKAERCKRSLFYFVVEFWDTFSTDKYEHNWHIEYLCDELQLSIDKFILKRPPHIEADKWYKGILDDIKRNLVANVPPGTSKSSILSRASCAWLWCVDDTKSIMGNTISSSNASGFAKNTLDIIKSEKYQQYFPNVKIRRDVSAKQYYESINGGVRYSYTTTAKSKTGKHVDYIPDDDPMDYSTAQSPAEAKECIGGFKALQSRKKDKRTSVYALFMQKLSSRDTSQHALKVFKTNVRHICLPAEDLYDNIMPAELRKYYISDENGNKLLDPVRLSKEVLKEQKEGLSDESLPISDLDYNIQYNQASETGEDLMYEKFNFVPSLPENRQGAIRFSTTDVADTGKDFFATWFWEINGNKVYIYDAIYTQDSSKMTSPKMKLKTELHGCFINKVESNNQGGVYSTLLNNIGVRNEGYYSSGNKEQRISANAQFSSYINFVEPGTQPYQSQEYSKAVKHMQSYPKVGKHDDGKDDAEDSFTEGLRYIWTNFRYLFTNNQ